MNRYFFIAPVYDFLKRIVFGKTLNNAASHYLSELPKSAVVLIVGGGTGASLPHFTKQHDVHFVDASGRMIRVAKKRPKDATVHFYTQAFNPALFNQKFDAICFPFFLDLFDQKEAIDLLNEVHNLLKPDGKLVITDFYPVETLQNWRQKLVLRTVIVFFNVTTWHKHSKIFNIPEAVKLSNYQLVSLKEFANGMVFASLWKRAEH